MRDANKRLIGLQVLYNVVVCGDLELITQLVADRVPCIRRESRRTIKEGGE